MQSEHSDQSNTETAGTPPVPEPEARALRALAAHAVEHDTDLAVQAHDRWFPGTTAQHEKHVAEALAGLLKDLTTEFGPATKSGATTNTLLRWLALYALAPPVPCGRTPIETLLVALPPDGMGDDPLGWAAAEALLHRWMALGPLGPLAFAAGLSVEEAEAGCAAESTNRDTWQTMAALRGWRLPPEM